MTISVCEYACVLCILCVMCVLCVLYVLYVLYVLSGLCLLCVCYVCTGVYSSIHTVCVCRFHDIAASGYVCTYCLTGIWAVPGESHPLQHLSWSVGTVHGE